VNYPVLLNLALTFETIALHFYLSDPIRGVGSHRVEDLNVVAKGVEVAKGRLRGSDE
jgi:hypothetical protein